MSTPAADRPRPGDRRILFVTPEPPSDRGGGLAMRAGSTLRALAVSGWEVHVAVVPVHGPRRSDGGPFVGELAAGYQVLDLDALAPAGLLDAATGLLGDPATRAAIAATSPRPAACRAISAGVVRAVSDLALGGAPGAPGPFDAVHVLRSYLAPVLDGLLSLPDRPACSLDLDEDDVVVAAELEWLGLAPGADRLSRDGDPAPDPTAGESAAYAALQRWYVPRVDRAAVASTAEARRIEDRLGLDPGSVAVLPNEVPAHGTGDASGSAHAGSAPGRPADGPDLLLVGNFSWPPNADAAAVLCERVRPALSAAMGREATVALVGRDPTPRMADLARHPAVTVTGLVEDVAPHYAAAGVAAVPMRVGGGSRIKLLEAMALGVPVVTTTVGAAGLEGSGEPPVAVADDVDGFVAACRDLLTDRTRRTSMSTGARRWVEAHHGPDAVRRALEGVAGCRGERA